MMSDNEFNFDITAYGGASDTGIDPALTKSDLQTILNAELHHQGVAGHHISTLNSFYSEGLKQIVTKVFTIESRIKNTRDKTEEDREISEISFKVEFTDIQLEKPTTVNYVTGHPEPSTPNACQVSDLSYSAIPYLSGRITATATKIGDPTRPIVVTRTDTFDRYRIAPILCGKHTQLCNLNGLSKETLKRLGEDPYEPGGTFIVNGSEWSIDNLENITYNIFHCHRNMYQTEIARGTFLSKAGDAFENSYQCLLRYKTNGAITIEITTSKVENIDLPFYLLFRAVGMTSDKDIVDHIVYGVDNEDYITKSLKTVLHRAFRADDPIFGSLKNNYNSIDIINSIALKITDMANATAAHRDENVIRYINNNILQIIDRFIFPHIGNTPSVRITKMRFLGHLINKLLLVAEEIVEPTDRDSLENKRIFAAGTSLAKAFKTHFNLAVVQPTKKALMKEFKSVPFSSVQLATVVKQAIKSDDLERMLIQSIVNGNKTITIRRNEINNRVSTQIINYKNDLNVISTLRSIAGSNSSASKQNERADEMRRVRPGFPGFICVTQSADTGESVGQTKQMAVGASISLATSSYVLKDLLLSDTDLMPLGQVPPSDITKHGLAKVFVNGDWIGCCKNAADFALKYRLARRIDHIRRSTTIVWKTTVREVYFWTDVGRMLAPHIIVYNNFAEYVASKRTGDGSVQFKQWITLTREHIVGLQSGKLSIEDLVKEGVIERLSAEECENCLVCPDLDSLKESSNDVLLQYTHLDIEQSIMGIVALAGPLGNHSNAVRNTMFTNHRKQSAGWFSMNFPHRIDKNLTFQWYGTRPLVSAFTDAWVLPNGQQVMGGVILYTGRNCEDSLLLNQGSRDLGMFTVTQFNYEQTELDKGESFGNPDYARTMDIKRDASYEHVEDGFVRVGTELEKGTVLMVKNLRLQKPVNEFMYSDKSIVYKKEEKARVDRVIKTRNAEDKSIGKVKYSATRYMGAGDKGCLLECHDVLTKRGWIPIPEVTLNDWVACLDGVSKKLIYHQPTELHEYDHDGPMYEIVSQQISQCVTLNHKLFVKTRKDSDPMHDFALIEARDIQGLRVHYKKNAIWDAPYVFTMTLTAADGESIDVDMDDWLDLLGVFISDGWVSHDKNQGYKVSISAKKQRKIDHINDIYNRLNIRSRRHGIETVIHNKYIHNMLKPLSVYAHSKYIPEYAFDVSQEQAQILMESLISGDGTIKDTGSWVYYTVSRRLADDVMRLALHCGWAANSKIGNKAGHTSVYNGQTITSNFDLIHVNIVKTKCEPQINHGHVHQQNIQVERQIHHNGKIYCLTVPTGIFYIRRDYKTSWTGNSSRTANKGISVGYIPRNDMPYNAYGVHLDVAANCHSFPTRMALNQLIETVHGIRCALDGSFIDGTMFNNLSVDDSIATLAKYGIQYGGHQRVYDGKTGEPMDALIFLGPMHYQRLEKFVIDEYYAVRTGPTAALTRQPLDGKVSDGGLRLGEMEKDVLSAHGSMRSLNSKFSKDSDGTTIYACRRCRNRATVNEKINLYKCKICGDAAEIVAIPSTWVANLLLTECNAMNIKTDLILEPLSFPEYM
jgi:DNA-directed RNA polymerase beta subunit